ncbi:MAG: hypothetical protein ACYDA1_04665 [Vulcanimicrobiaceae bacterium]
MRPAHPLCLALINRLRPGMNVVECGVGSGRNRRAMHAAGLFVDDFEALVPGKRYDGGLSTHYLLHGTPESIATTLGGLADALCVDGVLYATFGSIGDDRFGRGQKLGSHVYASTKGDEIGVPHTFWDEPQLRSVLEQRYRIESLSETVVDEIADRWAHQEQPLRNAVHWFAVLLRR